MKGILKLDACKVLETVTTACSKGKCLHVWIHVGYCNRYTCSLQGYSQQRSVSGSELQIFFLEISSQLSQPMEDVIAKLEEEEVDVIKLCTESSSYTTSEKKVPWSQTFADMNASVIIGAKVMTEAFSRIVGKSVFYNLELVTSQLAPA